MSRFFKSAAFPILIVVVLAFFLLPAPISIGHAGLAQLFFCLTVSLALFTSRDWRQPRVAVPTEVALQNAAVLCAVEQRAPLLQLAHAVGRLLGVQLGHAPVVEELSAAHGVAEVDHPVVVGVDVGHRRRTAALGHDGVRLAEE